MTLVLHFSVAKASLLEGGLLCESVKRKLIDLHKSHVNVPRMMVCGYGTGVKESPLAVELRT